MKQTCNTPSANHWITEFLTPTPDFPKPGILFQWYGKLLRNPQAFKRVINGFADRYREMEIDAVVGLEARGFIFGTTLAHALDIPLILIRKAGKLPGDVTSSSYEKEYGKDVFEIEKSALEGGERVLIIDDVVATGGTVLAAAQLIEQCNAQVVEVACMIELSNLNPRNKIPYPLFSLLPLTD